MYMTCDSFTAACGSVILLMVGVLGVVKSFIGVVMGVAVLEHPLYKMPRSSPEY